MNELTLAFRKTKVKTLLTSYLEGLQLDFDACTVFKKSISKVSELISNWRINENNFDSKLKNKIELKMTPRKQEMEIIEELRVEAFCAKEFHPNGAVKGFKKHKTAPSLHF